MNKLNEKLLVGYWLKLYLADYLPIIRNGSRNTIKSYSYCFCQLLSFIKSKGIVISKLKIEDLTLNIVSDFLNSIEVAQKCSITTRNLRLAAIRSFAKYVSSVEPQYLLWYSRLKYIPNKKENIKTFEGAAQLKIHYLEKEEMQALLNAPDKTTKQGMRDYVLLMFMYNTGTRVSEVVNMKISDIHIGSSNTVSVVYVRGKGNKTRPCPLWDTTVKLIEPFLHRFKDEAVFLNKYGNPITRFGIYELVTKYAVKAAELMPSIAEKNVSPHTIRHSTATHLLESGVDINTIRSWLGHVSINTTNIYAEINLKMKVKAIESCNLNNPDLKVKPITEQSIITFLKSLQ